MSYSVERLQAYIDIEREPSPTEQGNPPAYWPASGDIRAEKLSARYSPVCSSRVAFFFLDLCLWTD
jgi:hypothetical protein